MATAKYVMVACLAAGAPVAADDHAPTSLRKIGRAHV